MSSQCRRESSRCILTVNCTDRQFRLRKKRHCILRPSRGGCEGNVRLGGWISLSCLIPRGDTVASRYERSPNLTSRGRGKRVPRAGSAQFRFAALGTSTSGEKMRRNESRGCDKTAHDNVVKKIILASVVRLKARAISRRRSSPVHPRPRRRRGAQKWRANEVITVRAVANCRAL